MKKNQKNITFYWTGTKRVCILNALFALIVPLWLRADSAEASDQAGKTKIRATVVVKESRVLNKLSEVEKQLETLKRQLARQRQEIVVLEEQRLALEAQKSQLSTELIENRKRYKLQEDNYRRLQLGIAAKVSDSGKASATSREEQLSGALRKLSGDCEILTLAVNDYCDYMDTALRQLNIDKLEKTRIAFRLESLKKQAAMTTAVTEHYSRNQPVTRCRILAINDKLRVVILSAGLVHGVRNGLNWYGKQNKNSCRLQVVAVRPMICAAMLVDGKLKELAPGMELTIGSEKKLN